MNWAAVAKGGGGGQAKAQAPVNYAAAAQAKSSTATHLGEKKEAAASTGAAAAADSAQGEGPPPVDNDAADAFPALTISAPAPSASQSWGKNRARPTAPAPAKQSKVRSTVPTGQPKARKTKAATKTTARTPTIPSFNCLKCGHVKQSDLTDGCVIALPKREGRGYLYVRGEYVGRGVAEIKRTDGAMALVHDEQYESCYDASSDNVMFVYRGIYCDGDVESSDGSQSRHCFPRSATVKSTVDLHDVHPDVIRCEPDADGNYPQQMSTWGQQDKGSSSSDQTRDDGEDRDEDDPLSAVLGFQSWKNQY